MLTNLGRIHVAISEYLGVSFYRNQDQPSSLPLLLSSRYYLFSTAEQLYCWRCDPVMRRDIDDKRQGRLSYYCPCGNTRYNPDSHLCCQGKVYPKRRGHMCCGGRTYNCYSQLCCGGMVKSKSGSVCCGLVQFVLSHFLIIFTLCNTYRTM